MQVEQDRDRSCHRGQKKALPIVEIDRNSNILYVDPAMVEVLAPVGYDPNGKPDILPDNLPALGPPACWKASLTSQEVVRSEACYGWTLLPPSPAINSFVPQIDLSGAYTTHRALNATADHLREEQSPTGPGAAGPGGGRAQIVVFSRDHPQVAHPMNVIERPACCWTSLLPRQRLVCPNDSAKCGEAATSSLISPACAGMQQKSKPASWNWRHSDFQLQDTHVEDDAYRGLQGTGSEGRRERAERDSKFTEAESGAAVAQCATREPGRLQQVLFRTFVGNAVRIR